MFEVQEPFDKGMTAQDYIQDDFYSSKYLTFLVQLAQYILSIFFQPVCYIKREKIRPS